MNYFKTKEELSLKYKLKTLKTGFYTLQQLHEISGFRYKQSSFRALKKMKLDRFYRISKKTNRIEGYYYVKND